MTQSVIVEHRKEAVVYVKGSPESISKLCVPSSLPSDFFNKAKQSARGGIYQLVIATKAYTSDKGMHKVTRDDIEKDLEFLGFVNFQNSLKEESPAVINELRCANVDCVMITVCKFFFPFGNNLRLPSLPLTNTVYLLFSVQGDNVLTGQ